MSARFQHHFVVHATLSKDGQVSWTIDDEVCLPTSGERIWDNELGTWEKLWSHTDNDHVIEMDLRERLGSK